MSLMKSSRKLVVGGTSMKYAKANPPANMSVIQGRATYTYLFSRRVRAGERNMIPW